MINYKFDNYSDLVKLQPLTCFCDHLGLTECDQTCESSQPTCLATDLITSIITQTPRYNPVNGTDRIVPLVVNQTSLAHLND